MGQGKAGADPIRLFWLRLASGRFKEDNPVIGYYDNDTEEFYKEKKILRCCWCIDNPQILESSRRGRVDGQYIEYISTGTEMYKKMKGHINSKLLTSKCFMVIVCNDSSAPDSIDCTKDICYYCKGGRRRKKKDDPIDEPIVVVGKRLSITDHFIPSGSDYDRHKRWGPFRNHINAYFSSKFMRDRVYSKKPRRTTVIWDNGVLSKDCFKGYNNINTPHHSIKKVFSGGNEVGVYEKSVASLIGEGETAMMFWVFEDMKSKKEERYQDFILETTDQDMVMIVLMCLSHLYNPNTKTFKNRIFICKRGKKRTVANAKKITELEARIKISKEFKRKERMKKQKEELKKLKSVKRIQYITYMDMNQAFKNIHERFPNDKNCVQIVCFLILMGGCDFNDKMFPGVGYKFTFNVFYDNFETHKEMFEMKKIGFSVGTKQHQCEIITVNPDKLERFANDVYEVKFKKNKEKRFPNTQQDRDNRLIKMRQMMYGLTKMKLPYLRYKYGTVPIFKPCAKGSDGLPIWGYEMNFIENEVETKCTSSKKISRTCFL